jgi:hypothetical protein
MKMKLQEKFLPIDYEESLFEELILLRQGNTSVDEYVNKFHELSVRSQIAETGRQTLARFKAGLRDDIRKELLTVRLVSVEEAYQLALRVEQQLQTSKRTQTRWDSPMMRGSNPPLSRTVLGNNHERPTANNTLGWKSNEERRHRESRGAKTDRAKDECYKCGGRGHYAIVCPTKDQKFTLVCGEGITQEQPINMDNTLVETQDEDHDDEEILAGSNLPVCVIRRVLTGQRKRRWC